jgi:hypothetical protein
MRQTDRQTDTRSAAPGRLQEPSGGKSRRFRHVKRARARLPLLAAPAVEQGGRGRSLAIAFGWVMAPQRSLSGRNSLDSTDPVIPGTGPSGVVSVI